MAVRGEFSWPSVGNSGGRPRGILMAAYGEIAMAVDKMLECVAGLRLTLFDPLQGMSMC